MGLSSFIIWRQLFNTKKCLGEESVKLFCNACVWCKQAWFLSLVLFSHINYRPNFSSWISIKAMQNIHTKTIFTQKNALICAWKLNCGGADFNLLLQIVKKCSNILQWSNEVLFVQNKNANLKKLLQKQIWILFHVQSWWMFIGFHKSVIAVFFLSQL